MTFDKNMLIDLRRLRLTDTELRNDLLSGHYRKLTPEIAIWEDTWRRLEVWDKEIARDFAFGLSYDRAVLVGASAARVQGLAVLGRMPQVELAYLSRSSVRGKKYWPPQTVFRSAVLHEDEIYTKSGVRLTRIRRTIRDVTRYHGVLAGVVTIDDARRQDPTLTTSVLHHHITEAGGYHGVGKVRRAIDLSIDNADSPLESQARVILVCAGVGKVRPQALIQPVPGGPTYRVDLLIDDWLIIEVDGKVKYDGTTYGKSVDDVMFAERAREKHLQNAGYVVIRITLEDLILRPDGGCGLLDLVRAAQRRRAA